MNSPEPDLRRRIDAALDGKAVRLIRIERAASEGGSMDAPAGGVPVALGELDPEIVFTRCHVDKIADRASRVAAPGVPGTTRPLRSTRR